MGLHQAWGDAEITGVDIVPQPHYPFTFVQADAMRPPFDLKDFDFIWASPPCQNYSWSSGRARNEWGYTYPDLLEPTRKILERSGMLYVIENVIGAPMLTQIRLCGVMFGLGVIRHRNFESSRLILQPPHIDHEGTVGNGDFVTVAGHGGDGRASFHLWKEAMGITWMNKKELTESIPPAYSKFIAQQIRPIDSALRPVV